MLAKDWASRGGWDKMRPVAIADVYKEVSGVIDNIVKASNAKYRNDESIIIVSPILTRDEEAIGYLSKALRGFCDILVMNDMGDVEITRLGGYYPEKDESPEAHIRSTGDLIKLLTSVAVKTRGGDKSLNVVMTINSFISALEQHLDNFCKEVEGEGLNKLVPISLLENKLSKSLYELTPQISEVLNSPDNIQFVRSVKQEHLDDIFEDWMVKNADEFRQLNIRAKEENCLLPSRARVSIKTIPIDGNKYTHLSAGIVVYHAFGKESIEISMSKPPKDKE